MNHIDGGTYNFCEYFNQSYQNWVVKQYNISGESRINEQCKFRKGTKFVRIVILANYNSGHPDYAVINKNAQFSFRNVEFSEI